MSDDRSTFVTELKDEMSGPANDAAHALEQLRAKMEADTRALRGMQTAFARLKAGSLGNSKAADLLKARITAQKAAIASAQQQYVSLGGTFAGVGKDTEGLGGALSGLSSILGRAGPPGQALAGMLDKVSGGLKGMVPLIGLTIGAITALVAAVMAATVAMAHFGVSVADARRSEALHIEGMLALRRAHGYATTSALAVQSAIDNVARSSALSRSEIAGYASQIARTGVRGQQLNEILEVTAMTASAAGDAAAQSFASQAAWAARAGRSVTALADRWRSRFGAIATQQALGLDRQLARLHDDVAELFSGVKVDGFLADLHEVLSLFSQSTVTGQTLRHLITGMFGPATSSTHGFATALIHAFQDGLIAFLRFRLAFYELRNGIRRHSTAFRVLGSVIAAVFDGIMATPRAIVGAIGVIYDAAVDGLARVFQAIDTLGGLFTRAYDAMTHIDWSGIGDAIVDGITGGLRRGWARVTGTVRSLAGTLGSTFRDALGIHSPSRVFANLGVQIPRGVEQGIERGAGSANEAAESLVSPPSSPGSSGGRAGRQESRVSISFGDIHIHGGSGGGEPRDQARAFMDELASLLEGVGIQIGAPA